MELSTIKTPLQVDAAWEQSLTSHPDRAFVRYLSQGLRQGFWIGMDRRAVSLKSATRIMPLADQHPEVIREYLHKERQLGRLLGPFRDLTTLPALQINRFGVILKGHNTEKWRLITDLSYPPNHSVNNGIDEEFCSLSYISVDQVAEVASNYGQGALLAKVDIESSLQANPSASLRPPPTSNEL